MTEREVQLDALLSANAAPQALFAPDGRLLVANRGFAAALGHLPDEIEGRPLAEIGSSPTAAGHLESLIRRVTATGSSVTATGFLAGPALILTPVRDADGVIRSVAGVADASAALRLDLQAAQAEIECARQEAARARAAAGKFLSAASHDLRQPFQAMQLFHHLLMNKLTDATARDLGEKLEMAITGSEALLHALVEVSRLEAGLVEAQHETFLLDESLFRLGQEFQEEAGAKGLRLTIRPTSAEVHSDPVLLERLLRPLLSNALRYTDRGGVLVGARRRGSRLRIEVWDSGIGIREADIPAAFEDFRQLGDPNRDNRQGMGLGLSIVRRIAALLGHPVTVRSRPDRGTVVAIDLPLADDERRGGRKGGHKESKAADPDAQEKSTVLVIEDDAVQLEGMHLLLNDWGYGVIPARSLEEACAELDHHAAPPDLVLSDLHLPGPTTGIEAIRAVRERCGLSVPGLIMTGDTDAERLRRIGQLGLGLIQKPYSPAFLKGLLSEALAMGRTLLGGDGVARQPV